MLRTIVAFTLAVALPITSLAEPRVLNQQQLTEGSLLGQIASTDQLQREFVANAPLLQRASERLGLTRDDFLAVRRAIAERRARYVLIPRHLDGTSGEHGGNPFVDRDIVIPAHVYGWEVDLQRPEEIVRVFVLSPCGNISYLRVPKPYRVAAARYVPQPVPTPIPTPISTPTAAPIVAFVPSPAPLVTSPPVAAASHPHLGWLPFLVVPLIIAIAAGHGNSPSKPGVTPPLNNGCPTAIVIRL